MLDKLDGSPIGPAEQLLAPPLRSISGRSRRSVPSCSIKSNANSTASWSRRRLRSAWKSGVPFSRAITASPSIRNDDPLISSAASTNSRSVHGCQGSAPSGSRGFVSHFREIVVFRRARNLGKLHNTVRCIDCTVRPGSGSAAQMVRTIWSQRARTILIRLGENDADCPVSPEPSHQRNTG
jgi:hypothetical protein